jgi:hypothetical protein
MLDQFKDRRGDHHHGLVLLVSSGQCTRYPEQLHLTTHPFNLPLPEKCEAVNVITEGQGCDMNATAVAQSINSYLASMVKPTGLRIITIREVDDMAERRFFFEVQFEHFVIIGGGSTYFSGHGGYHTQQMRGLMLVLASIYNLDIVEELVLADKVQHFASEVLENVSTLRDFCGRFREAARTWTKQIAAPN